MPIYEYRCEKCGDFEVTQRITEDSLKKCPTCKRKVRKLISSTSFQLKGSGWYVTDYGRGGKEKGGAKEKGGESGAASESSPSGESKSETKPESKAKKPSAKAA